jgi:pimeloyl-ACP methyl ester carboxylesterase
MRLVLKAGTLAALFMLACPALAEDVPHRTGSFKTTFKERSELSDPKDVAGRISLSGEEKDKTDRYDMTQESYSVYVPRSYTPETPHGLIVWIHSGDGGDMPTAYSPLMDKYKLIWIGPDKAGNSQSVVARRVPLALDAVHNMRKLYSLDDRRIYISGHSGGGRVASQVGVNYSDVFNGGVYVCGVSYWREENIPSEPGRHWFAGCKKPSSAAMSKAKSDGRYVLLTGETDFNREQTWVYYDRGYKRLMDHALYLEVPGMGHSIAPPDWFEKAIVFLDAPLQEREVKARTPPPRTTAAPKAVPRAEDREVRMWTAQNGSKVGASLIEERGGQVVLRKADNAMITIRLHLLSPEDQAYIVNLRK